MHRKRSDTQRAQAAVAHRRRSPFRWLWGGARDTMLLLREFQWILLFFTITLILSALSFRFLWNQVAGYDPLRFIDALYFVMTLVFFEPTLDFPAAWYLDMYFFLMPALGVIFLTLGVADFAVLLFNRQARREQWEVSLASTYNKHTIVVGLGHVGIRVLRELVILGQDAVIIEPTEIPDHFEEARSYDVPVIQGDGRSLDTLNKAGLEAAAAVIICTDNDLANIQIASRIRDRRPEIRLVMRLFDDEFARVMADRFDITAVISSSALSAPAFAGAATGTEIIQTFRVEDRTLAMGRIEVAEGAHIEGMEVRDVEKAIDLSIVFLHSKDGLVDVHPPRGYVLQVGDVIAVVAELPTIKQLSTEWNRTPQETPGILDRLMSFRFGNGE